MNIYNRKLVKLLRFILTAAFLSIIFVKNSYADNLADKLLIIAKEKFHLEPKGVIHVGASIGHEADFYKSLNIQKIIWIEADPDAFKELVVNVKPDGVSIITENFAASDHNGVARFLRTNNQVSSSFFPLKDHKILWPTVTFKDEITVTTKRLDTYFAESKKSRISDYNVMVLDIQGAELLALKGATNTLKNIECVISEISYEQLYEGGVMIWELDEFLFKHGFVRADTLSFNIGTGDALYIRRKNSFDLQHKK